MVPRARARVPAPPAAMQALWLACALLAAAAAAAAAKRPDHDFEFDDDAVLAGAGGGASPHRYVYDPHSALCGGVVCARGRVCVVRDRSAALCADPRVLSHHGQAAAGAVGGGAGGAPDDDDVFYDAAVPPPPAPRGATIPDRCVGCGGGASGVGAGAGGDASFLCGSDNRTYSSLCRLDLHNCVRRARARPPVSVQCRGFCPCAAPPPAPPRIRRPPARRNPQPRTAHPYEDQWWRRGAGGGGSAPPAAHNEVLQGRVREGAGAACELDKMADRLLDWFSVLMDEARAHPPAPRGFPRDCKPEVRWMFAHLDADGDGLLSADNLYALRHDERERCLRPFLSACGGGGAGGGVSRGAWCACLRRAARPCTALARAHPAPHAGGYVPACDARGFYRARQCHPALGVCWCVSPHGVEVPGSRTRGAPACPAPHHPAPLPPDAGAAAGAGAGGGAAPADDEDAEAAGSGDAELRF